MSLPTLRTLALINGIFLLTLAIAMLVPVATLLVYAQPQGINAFLWSSLITFVCGLGMVLQGRGRPSHLRPRDMYMLTVSSWVLVSFFAALPFLFGQHISFTNAYFESMS